MRAPGDQTPSGAPAADRTGLALGFGAYLLWGFLTLYFPLLEPAGPVEIIAHRVVWSLVFCLVLLRVTGSWSAYVRALRDPRMLGTLAVAGVLVALNWLVFVFGVLSGHTVDTALGYYINPLVTVVLAVVLLGERLRPAQWAALGIGAVAVVVITVGVGRLPWIALVLAATFGLYGLLKNRVGRTVPAVASLAVETTVLTPVAGAYLAWLGLSGAAAFGAHGGGHVALLVGLGVVTAVPLLMFGAAARRLPLSVVGMLQYVAPTLQFLVGVLVFGEEMPTARWIGFGLVWLALVVLTVDGLRATRSPRRAAAAALSPRP
ncbi:MULTISPECIES: EamA family transporter RarD [unclassified Actinotalea]|uniref:EamA family transporter RarD n=1 Tax=unclassified Actinotalea TaxID=2638618 RepID=UPI0015F38874|nr:MULTISPECIES: EamA family transporter RarD [unclassified Actinotalea]